MTREELQQIKEFIKNKYSDYFDGEEIGLFYESLSKAYLLKDNIFNKTELAPDDYTNLERFGVTYSCVQDDEVISKLYYYILLDIDKNERLMLTKYIEILPNDLNADFTNTINRFKKGLKGSNFPEDWFINHMNLAIKEADDICMKYFYTLFTYYHGINDHDKNKQIVALTKDILSDKHPLWHYAYSQILSKASGEKNKDIMLRALEECKECIDIYMNPYNEFDWKYPGIYHAYAELVYETIEQGFLDDADDERKEHIQEGLKAIDIAIKCNPNRAKYYYTKGRLISVEENNQDRFKDAKELINQAINMEDSTRKDYDIICGQYMSALTKCKNDEEIQKLQNEINKQLDIIKLTSKEQSEQMDELTSQLKKEILVAEEAAKQQEEQMKKATEKLNQEIIAAKSAIEEEKKSVLEMLGFFSGIISIIIVSSQIVLALNAIDAMILLLGFFGVLILAFTFLRFVIIDGSFKNDNGTKKKRIRPAEIIMTFIGLIIVAASVSLLIIGRWYGWLSF